MQLTKVLIAHARFQDLVEGAEVGTCPKFDEAWVVTNGLFSDRAKTYAGAHGIKLMGWGYPKGRGLERIVDRSGLYPVTVLPELTDRELGAFAKAGLMLCQDLAGKEPEDIAEQTGIPLTRLIDLVRLAGEVSRSAMVAA